MPTTAKRATPVAAALAAAAVALGCLLAAPAPARAAGEAPPVPDTRFSFDGVFGTFDRGELQRGFQVYQQACAACHGLYQISYRHLRDIGLSEDQVRAIAASVQVRDGPNDEGAMFERPGRPADRFVRPYPNEQAARAANNGAYPPDLSLMVKAREGGADYLKALLVGYQDPPEGETVREGMYYNRYYPGHWIAMPQILNDGQVEYIDGTPATAEQHARDVTAFLAWAAEPNLEARRQMGVRIILFLTVLGGLVYAVKRKVWSDVH